MHIEKLVENEEYEVSSYSDYRTKNLSKYVGLGTLDNPLFLTSGETKAATWEFYRKDCKPTIKRFYDKVETKEVGS